ncbi:3-oxoacyl-[acyl-carrier protein] reductase [Pedococcus dokdonensis]|uniref:3-oxoacyl-[acyl-carrier protein] reductase n=1 Tax=Pedococcus dokdonensis TaxID=443156 RepID=A0A1H0N4X6_9MICO|nr:SDR family oxidoreductase [Pedococcus dokdonensis]SDO87703.1 3-oxoacyl-[acyl-carrier protein] reductase [Pedococcus dokdonensis]
MELTGRVVVVTGGASGLGEHLVRAFAREGAHVVVADLDTAPAEALAAALRQEGGGATGVRCDVTVEDDLLALVTAADALGGIDVLVNNAGGWGGAEQHYPEAPPEDWQAVLALNLHAPMRLLQLCLDGMRRRGWGSVVNVASSAGVGTTAYGSPPYAVAKAGLVRLTTALAGLQDEGVLVTCLVPGWIGLPRAHAELAALAPPERQASPELVPPEIIAAEAVRLVRDRVTAGTVVELLDGAHRRVVSPDGAGAAPG